MGCNDRRGRRANRLVTGGAGDSVAEIVVDASAINVVFGDNKDQFLIGPTNIPVADIAYRNSSGLRPLATLDFLHQRFKSGRAVSLGLDFDNPQTIGLGRNAGLLYGARVSARIQSGKEVKVLHGVLAGPTGRGYAVNDGFGLIDALAAYRRLKGWAAAAE